MPEGQGDATAGDFVSRVEFFGDAGNAPKRTEYVPVGVVEGLVSDVISNALEEEGNPRTGAQAQQQERLLCVAVLAELGDVIEAGAVLVDDVSDELCGVFRGTDGGADDAGTGVAAAFLADVDAGGVDDVDLAVHSGELGGVDWAALRSQEYVDLLDGELRVQPQALLQAYGSLDQLMSSAMQ